MAYGSGPLTIGRWAENVVASTQLVRPEGRAALGILYPANVALLLVAGLGLMATVRSGVDRSRLILFIALGVLPPVLGGLLYLPWPKFDSFYGLPFFVGPALLLAAGADRLIRAGGHRRVMTLLAMLAMVGYAAIPASRSSETAAAALFLNNNLARTLGMLTESDTVLVLGPTEGPRALPVKAVELREYSVSLGFITDASGPTLFDAPCDAVSRPGLLDRPNMTVLSYSYGCGGFPVADLRMNSPFRWRDWVNLRSVGDSVTAELFGPGIRRVME